MQQKTIRSYEIDSTGVIFTSDVIVFLNDDGSEVARGNASRSPFMAAKRDNAGNILAVDPSTLSSDPKLQALAEVFWTKDTVTAQSAALAEPPL